MTDTDEQTTSSSKKAKKAKKRQENDASEEHPQSAESSGEVADAIPEGAANAVSDATKSNSFATPKKKKFKKSVENAALQPDNDDGEDMVGLVPKPALSKRQKKKLKQTQNTEKNKDKEVEKTVAYLIKWQHHRDEWKYEKLRQIFVQKNVFDARVFNEEHSRLAIEYLATSMGAARENIIKRAEDIIRTVDDKITDENSEELTGSAEYTRAREILQSMQD